MLKKSVQEYKYPLLAASVMFSLLTIFVVWFVASEKTIYTWDFANYWRPAMDLSHQMRDSPIDALKTIIKRTRTDEYNLLHATLPAVWMLVFGVSRMSYILSIYLLYFIPATVAMAAVAYQLLLPLLKNVRKVSLPWIGVLLWMPIVFNPIILVPIVRGYPDIVGLGVISVVVLVYMRYRNALNNRYLLIMAVLLVLTTLLRRWYVAGSVGLIIGIGLDQLLLIARGRPSDWPSKIKQMAKLVVLPATYIGVFCLIAWPYIVYALSANYTASYSAYQRHHNYFELLFFTLNHFSLPIIAVAVFSLVMLALKKKDKGFVLVSMVSVLFSFFFVGRVQSFDAHQYYLLTLPVVVGVSLFPFLGVLFARERYPAMQRKALLIVSCAALPLLALSLNWYSIYIHKIEATPVLVSRLEIRPMIRDDLGDIAAMYSAVAEMGEDKKVYVIPSSNIFNIDTFRNVPLSLPVSKTISYNNYLYTSQLDTRDGFNTGFFDADIIVDVDPPGYIAALDQQQIVTYLHEQVTVGVLSQYYDKAHSYSTNEYNAAVYVRTKSIPKEVQNTIIETVKSTHEKVKIFHALTPYG